MPDKEPGFEWRVRDAQRKCDQVGEQGEAGVRGKKFPPDRKQFRVQNLLHTGKIDFRIFGKRMVSMNQQRPAGQQEQPDPRLVSFKSDIAHSLDLAGGLDVRESVAELMTGGSEVGSAPVLRDPASRMLQRTPPAPHKSDQWALISVTACACLCFI